MRCIYVLTASPGINVARVRAREMSGGHDAPEEKVHTRYYRALGLIPSVMEVSDVMHVYDNSGDVPFRIFKRRKSEFFAAGNEFWSLEDVSRLTGIQDLKPFPAIM